MDAELAAAVDHSGELKRWLVDYAYTPRFERPLRQALLQAAGGLRGILDEGTAFRTVDDFIFTHRTGANRTFIDDFLAKHRNLSPQDRDTLLGWCDSVEGIFEIVRKNQESLRLLNLIDDMEYPTYSNMGPGVFRPMHKGAFVQGRLVPVAGVWVVSGVLAVHGKAEARNLAQVAVSLALEFPRAVFRNPELLAKSWEMQRTKRAEFIAAFGSDELVMPPTEAHKRLRELDGDSSLVTELPAEDMECETIGLVYDEDDGFGIFMDYGKVKEMFADPALARDLSRAKVLLGYLHSADIEPWLLRRLAAGYPEGVDAVYRTVLRQRHFTWSAHGEALLRKHKPAYFERDRYPSVVVVGSRLGELARS